MKWLDHCAVLAVIALLAAQPARSATSPPSPATKTPPLSATAAAPRNSETEFPGRPATAFLVDVATLQARQNAGKLTPQELRSLTANASTPAEHRRLAEYFSYKAEFDLAQAMHHEKIALHYSASTVGSSSKFIPGTVNHCVSIVRELRRHAARMRTLEREQEQLARDAGE